MRGAARAPPRLPPTPIEIVTEAPATRSASFELAARVASGAALIAIAIVSVYFGGMVFAAWVSFAASWALREWHRLVNGGALSPETVPSALAVIAVAFLAAWHLPAFWPAIAIAAGAIATGAVAASRKGGVAWHAFGAFYLGIPALALVSLREFDLHHGLLLGAVLVAVWAADTGALVVGKVVGGPKLAPRLSPNKTWAGFAGGIVAAGAAEAVYGWVVGGAPAQALLFGFFLALAAHCGDLFESWVKRQFQAKVTGRLIPGHGGMLDRIDSLLFAAPVAALIILVLGVDPLFGSGR
jgi:phosphatidate cytidylyltransferase